MNNSLQLKSKESIIQELVDSYKHVNQALPHINRGGCGIFAEKLYIKCKALGLDPKIIVLTRCSEQMNERLKNEGEYLHKLFNDYRFTISDKAYIRHIMVRIDNHCIDSNSIKHIESIRDAVVEVGIDKLREWNANKRIWNSMFTHDRFSYKLIGEAINKAYGKINGKILVQKKMKKNLVVKK